MKRFIGVLSVMLFSFAGMAQTENIAALLRKLEISNEDTLKVQLLVDIANAYVKSNANEGIKYGEQALALSEKLEWQTGVRKSNTVLGDLYKSKNQYGKAVKYYSKGIKLPSVSVPVVSPGDGRSNREKLEEEKIQKERLQQELAQKEAAYRKRQQEAVALLNQQSELTEQQKLELEERQRDLLLKSEEIEAQKQAIAQTQAALERTAEEKQLAQEQLSVAEAERQLQEARLNALMQEKLLQEAEIEDKKKERRIILLAAALMVVVLGFTLYILVNQRKSNKLISKEKKKSDELLLNILPIEVANELKEKGEAEAKLYNEVTVLFSDFVGFTNVVEYLPPQDLVTELHTCFKAFDSIISKYGIEKIKTVGDAYMAVSGLPASNAEHAISIVNAALDIRDYMKKRHQELGDKTFKVRLGINSGSVVAGIVGVRKFAYDIWGDTVNIAARMEQNSESDKINISGATYELVKDHFICEHRGKIYAKNKGEIDMYFVIDRITQK